MILQIYHYSNNISEMVYFIMSVVFFKLFNVNTLKKHLELLVLQICKNFDLNRQELIGVFSGSAGSIPAILIFLCVVFRMFFNFIFLNFFYVLIVLYFCYSYFIVMNGDLPFNINTHLLLPFAIVVVLCLIIILILMVSIFYYFIFIKVI